MAAESNTIFGKWKLDPDKSDSNEELLKAQKVNTIMIKMLKSFRVQQEVKKESEDEVIVIMHLGKTVKIQSKTDHQPREMELEIYGKCVVSCWWEENNSVLVTAIDYNHKDVGPATETVHRSLTDDNTMKSVVNWRTKDDSHNITLNRIFDRKD